MDMARTVHRLTAVGVNRLKEAGIYSDGGNLNFRVAPGGSRSWVFRFAMNGKTRDAGLGPYPEVSLSEARVKAFEWRKLLVAGVDPLAQRNAERASNLVAASKSMRCWLGCGPARSLGTTPRRTRAINKRRRH